jgi:hypothetical protein
MTKHIEEYLNIIASGKGPAIAGTYASTLTDIQAKEVFNYLNDRNIKKTVRPLWYCYKRQCYRF